MKRLLLIGPGHGHLFVLEALAARPLRDVEVVLIACDATQPYSGMIPGYLVGEYALTELTFELAGLCRAAGAKLCVSPAIRLDASSREVQLEDGQTFTYDVASLDVGSLSAQDDLPGVRTHALTVKPIQRALDLTRLSGRAGHVVVVGGGVAAVELALCLSARRGVRVTLIGNSAELPAHSSLSLQRRVRKALDARGIEVRMGERVTGLEAGIAQLASNERLACDAVLWATGPRAPELLKTSGAALDEQGFLSIASTLQSVSHPNLFGAGDCVSLLGLQVPKSGVYAVRQGPVLARNLLNHLRGLPLTSYTPRRHHLKIINAGDGTALGSYGRFAFRSRLLRTLKDRLDRRFMNRFQRLGLFDPTP